MADTQDQITTNQTTQAQPSPGPAIPPSGVNFSFEINSEFVLLLVATLIAAWRAYGKQFARDRLRRLMGKRAYQIDHRIQRFLAEAVGRSDATRGLLYEFHNGEKLSTGRHFNKVSITNQYAKNGYSPILEIQNLPVASIITMLNEFKTLIETSPGEILSTIRIHNDAPDLYSELMRAYGTASSIYFLYSAHQNGSPIAILEFQFGADITQEMLEAERKEIAPIASQICFELKRSSKSWLTEVVPK